MDDCETCGLKKENCVCTPESAFPNEKSGGITIRDYLAAKAMSGFLSDVKTLSVIHIKSNLKGLTPAEAVSKASYKIADAMIAERDR